MLVGALWWLDGLVPFVAREPTWLSGLRGAATQPIASGPAPDRLS
jgi:hypothetical protein